MFPTDIDLINKVKQEQDNDAINELVNRHSGCYLQVVNKYCSMSSGKLSLQDLSEDKTYNIYKYAQTYNPDKECKFSTYVSNMTRYTCLDLLKKEPEIKEYLDAPDKFNGGICLEENIPTSYTTNENLDIFDLDVAIHKVIKNPKFKKIIKLRHPRFIAKSMCWTEIGKRVGMSNEGARRLYNRNIKKIKKYLQK